MNETTIVTIFVVVADVLSRWQRGDHPQNRWTDAEVLTVGIVAALYFQNHHERAVCVMYRMGYMSRRLSVSRFNRRLHQLHPWLDALITLLSELAQTDRVFILDSLPVPVCRRVRARHCRKVNGGPYYGRCVAKNERFFGWRLHVVYTADGIPAAFDVLPARYHDLTPIHELTAVLPTGACVYADKGYNCLAEEATIFAHTGVRLIPTRKKNMARHTWADEYDLRQYRQRAETFNSQLVAMGIQRLHALLMRALNSNLKRPSWRSRSLISLAISVIFSCPFSL